MEGMLLFPVDRTGRDQVQRCSDCGQTFTPRRLADGVEELCDNCYEAEFQPIRMHRWQKQHRQADHLH